jgi:transcriptional regulator with XRE-family HTH domain
MKEQHKIVLKTFGSQVRMIRLEKGFSLQHISKKSTLSSSRISRIENGEINIRLHTIHRIADALDVEVGSLLVDIMDPGV